MLREDTTINHRLHHTHEFSCNELEPNELREIINQRLNHFQEVD